MPDCCRFFNKTNRCKSDLQISSIDSPSRGGDSFAIFQKSDYFFVEKFGKTSAPPTNGMKLVDNSSYDCYTKTANTTANQYWSFSTKGPHCELYIAPNLL